MERDPLQDLRDEARAEQAAEARGRERRLRLEAEESATLVGTLLDLAEQGSPVSISTAAGRTHHAVVHVVGVDCCGLRTSQGHEVWIALPAVTTVRPAAGERHLPAGGDRPAPTDRRLVDVLALLVDDRPRVSVGTTGGESVAGELVAVGVDVVTLRLDGVPRTPCYLAVAGLAEVVLDGARGSDLLR